MEDSTAPKKRKIDGINVEVDEKSDVLSNFENFIFKKVIAENKKCKTVTIQAEKNGESAVILLEKVPFDAEHAGNYLSDKTTLKNTLKNDIYGTYQAFPPPQENALKAMVVYPATDKHIQKYSVQERFVIHETAELYNTVTLPLLDQKKFSIQWVYNILEKKQEADRIVFEDSDPELGFILLPDMKWDRNDTNSLYLVAIVQKHGIRSLRDLTEEHLPLLRNIREKGMEAIEKQFSVPASKIHTFLHYQPSYNHLHVHFTHIYLEAPGFGADRAHMLSDVIENIELASDYYQRRTLTYCVREMEELYKEFQNTGYFGKKEVSLSEDAVVGEAGDGVK